MEEQAPVAERRRRRRPSWRLVIFGVILLILLIVVIVWSQRRQIASDYVRREFERRGVQATYKVTEIGFKTQRMEDLVIGDPRRPDLVARSVEIEVALGWKTKVKLITARGVRMYGRIVGGKLSLGEVDKLLPPPTGAPFRFPNQDIDVADAAISLDTPAGRVGLAVQGRGNLSNGFRGQMAASARSLLLAGCAVQSPRAFADVAITGRRPSVKGPFQAQRLVCAGSDIDVAQPRLALDVTTPETLDSWIGDVGLEAAGSALGPARFDALTGRIGFAGDRALTRGAVRLGGARAKVGGYSAEGLSVDGRYAYSANGNRLSLVGDTGARGLAVSRAAIAPVTAALGSAAGTPIGPLGDALADAVGRAAGDIDAGGTVRLVNAPGSGAVRVQQLQATSRSGARFAIANGQGLTYYWPAGLARLDGEFSLNGGGFPASRVTLLQPRGGAPIQGEAWVSPFAARDARLQLSPVRFTAGGGGTTQIETIAQIDGPFKDGRVDGLRLPIRGRFGGGGFAFGERCTEVRFEALQAAGLRLGATSLPLCPTGRALLWRNAGGSLAGGADIRQPRLAGQLGQSPVSFAADRTRFAVAGPGFTSDNVQIRLGAPASQQRLDLASLSGNFNARGVTGAFGGGSGKIANVPLLLSGASGRWSVIGGDVAVDGTMTVADEADPARFYPLVTRDFRLTLVDSLIEATGTLLDPENGTKVTVATISHALKSGTGRAVLDVPGITFNEKYQPETLTRLTTGVVALVNGTVSGRGEINWSPAGTTSTGSFSTEKMDLAATFGPVEDLTGTIEFTDLLGLRTAPGQIANVGVIRTGIDVFDGLVRYQLLPDLRVKVEAGRWPFAGGELMLEETILDFSKPSPKNLVFGVVGADAQLFVQQFEFNNISVTGTFDGTLPMVFDERGGRIVGGRLEARPGGGTLSYIGELTDKQLGTYGKLAFDALKSLSYQRFIIGLDGSLDGEFLTRIELDGIARETAPQGGIVGAIVNRLAKIPFEFNITIKGPFRSLMATARSLEDPSLLIESVLPDVLQGLPTETIVQPQESETVQ